MNGRTDTIEELEQSLSRFDTLVISLFVPKAKPLNNFDIDDQYFNF
jgi:hypothetical protein